MSDYDHWKATERMSDAPWQECARCGYRDELTRLWLEDGNWHCRACWAELTPELPDTP